METNLVAEDGDGVFLFDLVGEEFKDTVNGSSGFFGVVCCCCCWCCFVILFPFDSNIEPDSDATLA